MIPPKGGPTATQQTEMVIFKRIQKKAKSVFSTATATYSRIGLNDITDEDRKQTATVAGMIVRCHVLAERVLHHVISGMNVR